MRANALPASPSRSVLTIGMAPPTAASKLSATLVLLGERRKLDAVPRQQRLVGGDHRLAGLAAPPSTAARAGSPSPPISSTKTSMPGSRRKRDRIGDPAQLLQIDAAILAARARADRDDLDRPAAARGERCALLGDQAHHRGADRAETGKTHFERGSHETSAIEERRLAPRGERDDVVQLFRRRFQGNGGCCARPGGCAARSRPARCAQSPRRARRSRCPATPRPRPSRPAAWRIRRCRASGTAPGSAPRRTSRRAGGGTCQPARPKLSTSTSRRRL